MATMALFFDHWRLLLLTPFFFSLVFCQGCSDDPAGLLGDLDPDVPFAVNDLAVAVLGDTIRLTWTATGDDGPNGTATRYDLREYDQPITDTSWSSASQIPGTPRPQEAGSRESFDLPAGSSETTFYMALKVVDDHGNRSGLSNVVFLDRQPPAPVTDLTTGRITDTFAVLEWTSPADDGPLGRPYRYEIRISQEALTETNWMDISPRDGPNNPVDAGQTEEFVLPGLAPLTSYYAAVRSRDESGNFSEISNFLEFTTQNIPLGWGDEFADLDINDRVNTLYSLGDTLYVGGPFSRIGTALTWGIAAYDGTDFRAMGTGLAGGRWGPQAFDMAYYDGALHVAGSFYNAGDVPVANLARWTSSGWESLGDGPSDNAVHTLCEFNGDLYFGGAFYDSDSSPFTWLTRYDGNSFHSMGWRDGVGGWVLGLLNFKNSLVITGGFDDVPGHDAESVALWNGISYSIPQPHLVAEWETPFIMASCEFQGDLILAGDFTGNGQIGLNHIARWDGNSWHPLGSGISGGDRITIPAMVVYKGLLVVGGQFESAGGVAVNNIAMWDGTYWRALGSGVEGSVSGSPHVGSLVSHDGGLYVGGNFLTAGGKPSPSLARWDLD
ncbi:MAG: hypothetical protein ABFS42_15215 [Candidatus Krumholzibacteriota bacterium]